MGRARQTVHAGVLNYGSYEIYRDYRKCWQSMEYDLVDKDTHKRILARVYELIHQAMIKDLMIFKAPMDMGQFYIKEVISKSDKYIDWIATNKLGKRVYAYNITGNLKFKFYWNKAYSRAPYIRAYWFKRVKGYEENTTGARGLSSHILKLAKDPYQKDYRAHLQ